MIMIKKERKEKKKEIKKKNKHYRGLNSDLKIGSLTPKPLDHHDTLRGRENGVEITCPSMHETRP